MQNQKMRQGVLVNSIDRDRMDIRFGLHDYYDGLHCGEAFDVKINGKWIHTSIEKSNGWYLVGINTESLVGLQVRI